MKPRTVRPLRAVTRARLRSVNAMSNWSGAGAGTPKSRVWDLELECGHEVERRCSYQPRGDGRRELRGWAAIFHPKPASLVLPAPRRVRCETCAPVGD